jgi:oleandomycin transport system ATP-binding protein
MTDAIQTLEVRPADPADLPAVIGVAGSVTRGIPRIDAPGVVRVATDDPGALAEVQSWLLEAGIPIAEITLRRQP